MRVYRFGLISSLAGIILLTGLLAWAEEQKSPNDFLGHINNRTFFRQNHPWAVFLGAGWTKESLEQIEQWQREGKWINPFTGQPFPKDTPIFVFGQNNQILEGLRLATDHLEIHVLSSWEELKGYHVDFGICHSNGCTNAIDAHREGIMRVETFLALGNDWTSKAFQPGELKGAAVYFFATKGDPIWKIPAPDWARVTEATPGFKFSIPFDHPKEIGKGMGNLFTQGRADPDQFPVIRLDPPPGQKGTPLKLFRPHALVDSYFPAIGQWMKSQGSLQKALTEKIRRTEASLREDQKKRDSSPPGCPPKCDGGGGGGRGGPSQGIGGRGQENPMSGVLIDPQPVKTGPGGSEIKKQVLDARGSGKDPTWGVELP